MNLEQDNSERDDRSPSTTHLRRLQDRDPQSWEQLVAELARPVYLRARQTGLQPHDAEDIVQEVFGAVAGNIERFRRDGPNDSFRKWFWTITNNKIRDRFRKLVQQIDAKGGTTFQARMANAPEQTPEPSGATSLASHRNGEQWAAIERIKCQFEPHTWAAFVGTTIDRLPASQVAEELGMTVPAVYQAKSRILRRVRQELGKSDDE
jgi:RNA polymerase sigma-70 factor (ECF subfamily)